MPWQRHRSRRRGSSLTLYHTAVTNSQLRRKLNRNRCCSEKTSSLPATDPTNSPVHQTSENVDDSIAILRDSCGGTKNIEEMSSISPESDGREGLSTKNIDDSLDILQDCCGGKLSVKNVEEMSLLIAPDSNGRAKNIDDSLDILSDCSDAAVVPVTSDDSGRSSCQSSVLSSLPVVGRHQSPSISPAYLMTSMQSANTESTSSSFNDLQLHCFSSDGLSEYYLTITFDMS